MENTLDMLMENSKQAVRYWWLLLVSGIVLFGMGIVTFAYPAQSYRGMALLFGWVILFLGLLQTALSAANNHFITGRGWMLAGGIIEIILGIMLVFNPSLSESSLPFFLGFWLLFRSFNLIGLAGDMNAVQVPGSGWTIASGVLLLIFSLWIIFQPLVFGVTAVVVWVAVSLLFAGAGACSLAFQLRRAHEYLQK